MTTDYSFRKGADFGFSRARQMMENVARQLEESRRNVVHMPEPVYTRPTQQRVDRLPPAARWIFERVLESMQSAEDDGGPEGQEYIDLMNAIVDEATERARHCRSALMPDGTKPDDA